MKQILYLLLFCMLIMGMDVRAQTDPQYSHYMYNKLLFNPAYAGSNDAVEMNALYRTTYVGLSERATSTEYLSANLPLYRISSGIGLNVSNDMIGYLRTTSVNINYDYRKKFKFGALGIGVGLGIIETGLEGDMLETPDGGKGGTQKDPVVPQSNTNIVTPDFSVGLYLNNDRYFVGLSMDHLYSVAKFSFTNSITHKLQNSQIDYARELLVMGGYDFLVGKHFSIMPSTLIKTDLKELQVDLSFTMRIYDNILTGLAFRGYDAATIDAAILYAGFQYKSFRFVYSYDVNTSYLRGFNTGSHEVSVAYKIGLKKQVKTGYFYHNSRFL